MKGMFLVFVWGVSVMWWDNPTSYPCLPTQQGIRFFSSSWSPFYEMWSGTELSEKIIIWVGHGNNAKGQQLRQNLDEKVNQYVEQRAGEMVWAPRPLGKQQGLLKLLWSITMIQAGRTEIVLDLKQAAALG